MNETDGCVRCEGAPPQGACRLHRRGICRVRHPGLPLAGGIGPSTSRSTSTTHVVEEMRARIVAPQVRDDETMLTARTNEDTAHRQEGEQGKMSATSSPET